MAWKITSHHIFRSVFLFGLGHDHISSEICLAVSKRYAHGAGSLGTRRLCPDGWCVVLLQQEFRNEPPSSIFLMRMQGEQKPSPRDGISGLSIARFEFNWFKILPARRDIDILCSSLNLSRFRVLISMRPCQDGKKKKFQNRATRWQQIMWCQA